MKNFTQWILKKWQKTWEVFLITLISENRERSYRVAQKKTRDVSDI